MILDRVTFLEKGIKTSDPQRLMWTQVKQNYDRHVEQMENWNDIDDEEDQASKPKLVPLFFMD